MKRLWIRLKTGKCKQMQSDMTSDMTDASAVMGFYILYRNMSW